MPLKGLERCSVKEQTWLLWLQILSSSVSWTCTWKRFFLVEYFGNDPSLGWLVPGSQSLSTSGLIMTITGYVVSLVFVFLCRCASLNRDLFMYKRFFSGKSQLFVSALGIGNYNNKTQCRSMGRGRGAALPPKKKIVWYKIKIFPSRITYPINNFSQLTITGNCSQKAGNAILGIFFLFCFLTFTFVSNLYCSG